jgi:pimeloyl-ACP methyl ester carboxylesterase
VAPLREEHVDVDGRDTAYLTAGEGDPLVFFHGGGIVEWFDCFAPLADGFRFIAPFHPGFHTTALDPAPQNVDQLVDHYEAFFEQLDLDNFVLVGHSLGGWIAASYAAAHPERVKRLVVVSPYGLDVPGFEGANVFAMQPHEVYAALTKDDSIWEGRMPTTPEEEERFTAARQLEAQAVGTLVPGPFDPSLEAKLRNLPMPTLLLWGDDDKIVPVGKAPAWEAALPNNESRVYEGAGHLLFHERRDAVDAVAEFAAKG